MGPLDPTVKFRVPVADEVKVKASLCLPAPKAYAMGKRKERLPAPSEEKIPIAERRGKAKNVKT